MVVTFVGVPGDVIRQSSTIWRVPVTVLVFVAGEHHSLVILTVFPDPTALLMPKITVFAAGFVTAARYAL